jgi:hypothetical protein
MARRENNMKHYEPVIELDDTTPENPDAGTTAYATMRVTRHGNWRRADEVNTALTKARAEVPEEIAAVVRVAERINSENEAVDGCDCSMCKVVYAFRGLTPAQRKACGLPR